MSKDRSKYGHNGEGEYFRIKDEFVQNSPEHLLYTAIYQVKKDLKNRYPTDNPYTKRNSRGDYILLPALSNLAFLLASQEMDLPFDVILDQLDAAQVIAERVPDIIDPEIEKRLSERPSVEDLLP